MQGAARLRCYWPTAKLRRMEANKESSSVSAPVADLSLPRFDSALLSIDAARFASETLPAHGR